jgi:uncharacterized protein
MTIPVGSPCRKICAVDRASGLCAGCGRTLAEIAGWSSASDAEKQTIVDQLPERLSALSRYRRRAG